jgi:hypothetical protein
MCLNSGRSGIRIALSNLRIRWEESMRLGVTALAAFAAALALAAGAPAAVFTPGAAGSGDPFFPNAGNGGYDVSSYD